MCCGRQTSFIHSHTTQVRRRFEKRQESLQERVSFEIKASNECTKEECQKSCDVIVGRYAAVNVLCNKNLRVHTLSAADDNVCDDSQICRSYRILFFYVSLEETLSAQLSKKERERRVARIF